MNAAGRFVQGFLRGYRFQRNVRLRRETEPRQTFMPPRQVTLNEGIPDRIGKRLRDSRPIARTDLLGAVLYGLVVWGGGSLICHWLGVSSNFALALGLLVAVFYWRQASKSWQDRVFEYVIDEFEIFLKDYFDRLHRDIDELRNEIRRGSRSD
jgi:hypothetical protein